MLIKQDISNASNPLTHAQENAPMNLDSHSRLETQRREAEVRHHLEKRKLELAAIRQSRQAAAARASGYGLMSRLVGRLAPRRVATASGNTAERAAPQPAAQKTTDGCSPGLDCSATPAHRSAS